MEATAGAEAVLDAVIAGAGATVALGTVSWTLAAGGGACDARVPLRSRLSRSSGASLVSSVLFGAAGATVGGAGRGAGATGGSGVSGGPRLAAAELATGAEPCLS